VRTKERRNTVPEKQMQTYLAQFSFGRILLHLGSACRDHKYRWHWRGIWRELAKWLMQH
jgi:hypothetical protein